MWTVFETLAGDLWVAALNSGPQGLASLSGAKSRIRDVSRNKTPKEPTGRRQDEGMMIALASIHDFTYCTYDLHDRLGDLLRKKVSFTSLEGIRESYSRAFADREDRARTGID